MLILLLQHRADAHKPSKHKWGPGSTSKKLASTNDDWQARTRAGEVPTSANGCDWAGEGGWVQSIQCCTPTSGRSQGAYTILTSILKLNNHFTPLDLQGCDIVLPHWPPTSHCDSLGALPPLPPATPATPTPPLVTPATGLHLPSTPTNESSWLVGWFSLGSYILIL